MSDKKENLTRADQKLWGLMAEYDSPGALKKAAAEVRKAGYKKWDCYSPFPVHGLDPAMGIKMTILPVLVFAVGITGTCLGLLLQWWANAYDWPWIVSGKPFFSMPANIPITFEVTVLLAAFTAFFGQWGLNKLPQVWHPLFKRDRFVKVTDDGFFIAIESADPNFDAAATRKLLEAAGATAIEECHVSTDPNRRRVPKAVLGFIVMSSALALVPFAFVAKARTSTSREPHVHLIPDMDFQAHRKAQAPSDFFADGRADRVWPEGTVAYGQLKLDDAFYKGVQGGQWMTELPTRPGIFEVSEATMERGRERFDIFCAPCHGASGYGNGMVNKRAEQLGGAKWVPPANLHQEYIVRQPHGQLFHTISNGIRNMKGYGAQIPEADRWAIVLYIRALQRSQASQAGDAPADMPRQ